MAFTISPRGVRGNYLRTSGGISELPVQIAKPAGIFRNLFFKGRAEIKNNVLHDVLRTLSRAHLLREDMKPDADPEVMPAGLPASHEVGGEGSHRRVESGFTDGGSSSSSSVSLSPREEQAGSPAASAQTTLILSPDDLHFFVQLALFNINPDGTMPTVAAMDERIGRKYSNLDDPKRRLAFEIAGLAQNESVHRDITRNGMRVLFSLYIFFVKPSGVPFQEDSFKNWVKGEVFGYADDRPVDPKLRQRLDAALARTKEYTRALSLSTAVGVDPCLVLCAGRTRYAPQSYTIPGAPPSPLEVRVERVEQVMAAPLRTVWQWFTTVFHTASVALNAVRDLRAEVAAQEERIAAQEERIAAQEERIAALTRDMAGITALALAQREELNALLRAAAPSGVRAPSSAAFGSTAAGAVES